MLQLKKLGDLFGILGDASNRYDSQRNPETILMRRFDHFSYSNAFTDAQVNKIAQAPCASRITRRIHEPYNKKEGRRQSGQEKSLARQSPTFTDRIKIKDL